jgi:hypothetical protein
MKGKKGRKRKYYFGCGCAWKWKSFQFLNLFYASSFGNKWKSIKNSLFSFLSLWEWNEEIFITINACVHIFCFFLSVICCRHVKYLYFHIFFPWKISLLALLVLLLLVYSLMLLI